MSSFVKYFETIAVNHKLCYEKFSICAYISPNGISYRSWLTVKQNTWNKNSISVIQLTKINKIKGVFL